MSVILTLDSLQSNDNKTWLLTDTTGVYNAVTNVGGWGTPNEAVNEVVPTTITSSGDYHLTLSITYTNPSDVETTYDDIDLITDFTSEFSKTSGMEYEINMSHLKVSTIAAGTSSDVLPDGKYEVSYTIADADTSTVVYTGEYIILLTGVIRSMVNDLIYQVPNVYKQSQFNADDADWQTLLNSEFLYSYYRSLITNNDDSEVDHKMEMLSFLEQRLNG